MPQRPSRIVILASGVGSRLRSRSTPKPLARLAGLTLLERAIVAARDAGFSEVIVVSGYRHDEVTRHALHVSQERIVAVKVVHNPRFREGNALSLLAAADEVATDDRFAVVMADHVFSSSVVERLRRIVDGTASRADVLVFVDRSCGAATAVDAADAMKVRIEADAVVAIGKGLSGFDGFDVGAFVCTRDVFAAIKRAEADGDTSLAAAVQVAAEAGSVGAVELDDDEWWFDVDTRGDRRNGARFLYRGTGKPLDGAVAGRLNRLVSQRLVTPALLTVAPSITPNQVTILAFAVAVVASVTAAIGATLLAALFVTMASVLDGSDGEVARLTRRQSRFGAFFDAVLDRAADGLLLAGIAYYAQQHAGLSPAGSTAATVLAATALVGHLLVSYTTARAGLDLGHTYVGRLLGGGHGRDLRLAVITAGLVGAAWEPLALVVALAAIAGLTTWIVVARLRLSWRAEGTDRSWCDIDAVALDFDGTVADSMPFLTDLAVRVLVEEAALTVDDARARYLVTIGTDFGSQLEEIVPDHPRSEAIRDRFERERSAWMPSCEPFPDVLPALSALAKLGVPILVCSSTDRRLVVEFCQRQGLISLLDACDGWAPGHPKSDQLHAWITEKALDPDRVVLVGDARRDLAVADATGARFAGLLRAGHTDVFAGTGCVLIRSLATLSSALQRIRGGAVRFAAPSSRQPGEAINVRSRVVGASALTQDVDEEQRSRMG